MHLRLLPALFAACFVAAGGAEADEALSVASGQAATFQLSAEAGEGLPRKVRMSRIGSSEPQDKEVTMGLAPAGGAVGMAKLHMMQRVGSSMKVKIIALHGKHAVASENLCGDLSVDSWVALPAETSRVVLSHFVLAEDQCPRH